MNLLFLEERPRFVGGSERMSLALCGHAVARGHRAWLAYRTPGDMVQAYEAAGASTTAVPAVPIAVRHPITAWRSFASLRRLVTRARIDVMMTSQVNYASLLAAVGKTTGARTCMHLGLTYDYPSPIFRAGIRNLDLGVAPSAHTADGWRARQWPERSLHVIPNGVDTHTFFPSEDAARRQRLSLPDDEPVVAYVGRLVLEKGIVTLLRAFARFRGRHGRGHLIFVGEAPAEEAADLRRTARDEQLPDTAWQIRPPIATPQEIYRAADVIVVPSEWDEPFGLVPLEAMACGTLTLVSDRGVLPSFVSAIGDRAVFTSGDADQLRDRLDYWLADRTRREHAAACLLNDVRARFSFDRCGDAYLDLFQSLLAA